MIDQLNGSGDSNGNEYSQWQTTDATVNESVRFTPDEKEAGRLTINYNAANVNTAAAVDKVKMVRYKKVNGVVSLINAVTIYTSADTGMTGADVLITAVGGEVVLTLKGATATTVVHTVHMNKLSSVIRD